MPPYAGIIGVGRGDITPPIGIYARNWGASAHDQAEGVHRPLTVTALTLQESAQEPPLVLVSADLGWWRRAQDERRVRQAVLDALQLAPDRLMLCFTHTHAGPSICPADADRPGGERIAPYLDHLTQEIIRTTQRALADAEPALLEWGAGRCDLATHRDLPDPDGERFLNGWNPEGEADDTVTVGRITNEQGAIKATLVHYACHPTTLAWENRLLSPDYIGAMRETVERATNAAPCLFLLGACGDLAPREQYTGEVEVADRNGRRLGFAALSALEGMLPPGTKMTYRGVVESGAPLAVWKPEPQPTVRTLRAHLETVVYPVQASLPSLAELDRALAERPERVQAERLQRKRRIRESIGDGATAEMSLWAWEVGDAVLLGQPNEAYSEWQTALRAYQPDRPVLAINVVNGHFGYLPPASLYHFDAYAVWQSPFAAGSLERLITASLPLTERD